MCIHYVKVLAFRGCELGEVVEVLEYSVLTYSFRAATPVNELELRDALVRGDIESLARVSSA